MVRRKNIEDMIVISPKDEIHAIKEEVSYQIDLCDLKSWTTGSCIINYTRSIAERNREGHRVTGHSKYFPSFFHVWLPAADGVLSSEVGNSVPEVLDIAWP